MKFDLDSLDLDSPNGHILCVLALFFTGTIVYLTGRDYGKDVMTGAMGGLLALINSRRGSVNMQPGTVNQADTIINQKESS